MKVEISGDYGYVQQYLVQQVKHVGRRRRRVVKVVKKKLPSVFTCPRCSEEAVRVTMPRGDGLANVQCAACGLKDEFEAPSPIQMVDVYCKFTDKYYGRGESAKPSAPVVAPETSKESSQEENGTQISEKIKESPVSSDVAPSHEFEYREDSSVVHENNPQA